MNQNHWLLDKEEYNKDGFTQEEVEALTGIVEKPWGSYKVLHRGDGYTVKELTILPGKSLSDQRHFKRDEHWLVVKGVLSIDLQHPQMPKDHDEIHPTETAYISKECWHRPHNKGAEEVKVIEVWLGDSSEDDIERR